MVSETKVCQNCKQNFTIEEEDSLFYQKVQVPSPTFCPDCRFQRRLMFWNAVNLYRRPCDLCHEFSISVYPPEAPYTVYCPVCWWSDKWSGTDYAKEYDFSRPFFEQLNELWHKVPLIGLSNDLTTIQTSPYNHDAGHLKNCYLLFQAEEAEESAYGYYVGHSQNMLDSTSVQQCQWGYDSMHSFKTNRCIGSREQLSNSIDCYFCRDCQDCQNCFASANLKNKKYYAWNKQLSREEYQTEIAKYDLGSYKTYCEIKKRAEISWKKYIPKSEYNEFVTNCTGSNVFFSKNTRDSIESYNCEDCRYLFRMWGPVRDCYDVSMWGVNLSESYESLVIGENSNKLRFCNESGLNHSDSEYCKVCLGGSHRFGCVGLKKGEYSILNKQYGREEYEQMVLKIKQQMNDLPYRDTRGNIYRYGEFFPSDMSPFAYNTTLAQNFFPLNKEQTVNRKYIWRDEKESEHKPTMKADDLPDNIKDTPDAILKEQIACVVCAKPYRIIEMELSFLRQMNLPLPRACPFCRINEKLNIWVKTNRRIPRVCADCGINMESHYAIEEYAQVYCRVCYNKRREE